MKSKKHCVLCVKDGLVQFGGPPPESILFKEDTLQRDKNYLALRVSPLHVLVCTPWRLQFASPQNTFPLRNEVVFSAKQRSFICKDLLLLQDWLKFSKHRLFGTKAICPKKLCSATFNQSSAERHLSDTLLGKKLVCTADKPTLFVTTFFFDKRSSKVHCVA